jgi:hypothetical protein
MICTVNGHSPYKPVSLRYLPGTGRAQVVSWIPTGAWPLMCTPYLLAEIGNPLDPLIAGSLHFLVFLEFSANSYPFYHSHLAYSSSFVRILN